MNSSGVGPVGPAPLLRPVRPGFWGQLWRFALIQVQCCVFPIALVAGLALTIGVWSVWDPPVARYDVLFGYALVVQLVLVAMRVETGRELAVICCFHLLGLGLEIFKTQMGSWGYPDPGLLRIAGVPAFSGFMYASVGSYICQAFWRFALRVSHYPAAAMVVLAGCSYANFFTHHWLPDLRVVLALAFVAVLWRSRVWFRVGLRWYWMPLWAAFVLIGAALWVAENLATLLGAWRYPDKASGWHLVHVGKWGSWALLVSLSFALVAAVKQWEGQLEPDGNWPTAD